MTDPDPPSDPNGADVDSGGAGPNGDDAGGREPATDRRVEPRLADASDEGSGTDLANGADGGSADALDAFRDPDPIEPESPSAENALFVLLGVLATVALLATAIVPGVL